MHKSWSTQTRIFVISIMLILFAILLVYIHSLLRPLVIAGLLAFMLYPIATAIRRRTPLKQRAAGNLVFFVFLALIAAIPSVVTPLIIGEMDTLGEQLVVIIGGINDFLSQTTVLGYRIFSTVPADIETSLTGMFRPEVLYESIGAVTENLVWVGVIMIVVYYLMVDWPQARKKIYDAVPDDLKQDGFELFNRLRKIWNVYLRGQLSTMLLLGVISGITAALLGLPAAIILGLGAAAFGLVPSVGSSLYVVVPGLVALFSGTTLFGLPKFWYVVIVVGVFAGIHLFENYWLRPKVLGQGLRLHPAVILVSVLGAITVGGGLLALVVIPVISSAGVVIQYLIRRLSDEDPWAEDLGHRTGEDLIEGE